MPRPTTTDYGSFYQPYIDQTEINDVQYLLQQSLLPMEEFLSSIPLSKIDYAYAEGKWTLKELMQHLIDTERIMSYRALCVARGEQKNLPGFDENDYVVKSNAGERTWDSLKEEMSLVRKSTILLFNSFNKELLQQKGKANNYSITTNALGFIIVGHVLHHQRIIIERYL